jgi:tetratricopeptide (TPR) repeat protein
MLKKVGNVIKLKKANQLFYNSRLKEAESLYRQILETDSEHFEANLWLGSVYSEQHQFEKAAVHFEKAIAIKPSDSQAYYNYAVMNKSTNNVDKSILLVEDINPLFVSRYPQNQNKDVIKWLSSIPNNYLHFGDFDIAGIGIYLNEYKKYLIDKATFFIPEYLEKELRENGNRERYNVQKVNFKLNEIEENKLLKLIDLINTQKKGLDQEYYISE